MQHVRGRVVELGSDAPAAGVTIVFSHPDGTAERRTTGPVGEFAWDALPGTYAMVLRSSSDEPALAAAMSTLEITPGLDIVDMRLVWAPGRSLRFKMVDGHGRSIPGVRAAVVRAPWEGDVPPALEQKSNDAGELACDSRVCDLVSFSAPGFEDRMLRLDESVLWRDTFVVEMRSRSGIDTCLQSFRVVDPDGNPVSHAGAQVCRAGETPIATRFTDRKGLVELPVVRRADRIQVFLKARHASLLVSAQACRSEETVIALPQSSADLGVTVVDQQRQPVTTFGAKLFGPLETAGPIELRSGTVVSCRGSLSWERLPAGTLQLEVVAPGYRTATKKIRLVDRQRTRATVILEPASRVVTARVRDRDTTSPILSAWVTPSPRRFTLLSPLSVEPIAASDGTGSVSISGWSDDVPLLFGAKGRRPRIVSAIELRPHKLESFPLELSPETPGQATIEMVGIGARLVGKPGRPGAVVDALVSGGGAGRAGLRPGDVIEMIDGADVRTTPPSELLSLLRGPAGSKVLLRIYRPEAGRRQDVVVERRLFQL